MNEDDDSIFEIEKLKNQPTSKFEIERMNFKVFLLLPNLTPSDTLNIYHSYKNRSNISRSFFTVIGVPVHRVG